MAHGKHGTAANRGTVVFFVLVVGGLIGSVVVLARHGISQRAAEKLAPRWSVPALVRGADNPTHAPHPRVAWAAEWQQKMGQRGHPLTATVVGRDFETLELNFTAKDVDRDHMGTLQQAAGFADNLKREGFRRLVMRVDGKQVFLKSL